MGGRGGPRHSLRRAGGGARADYPAQGRGDGRAPLPRARAPASRGADERTAADGERFRALDHPFLDDLDVFGRASLFQLLDTTETRFGEERLASILSNTEPTGFPSAVRARQEAVKDLAGRLAFRERLSASGALLGAEKPDPRPFLAWAEGSSPLPHGALVRWGARLLPLVFIAAIAVGSAMGYGRIASISVVSAALLFSLVLHGKVGKIAAIVSSREMGLLRYGELFRALETEGFQSQLALSLKERLGAKGASATDHMRALARILGFLDARNNEVFRFFIGPLLMWDVHCAIALLRWRARGADVRGWLEALGEIEALASLAGLRLRAPRLSPGPSSRREPLLRGRRRSATRSRRRARVGNDVALAGAGDGARGHGLEHVRQEHAAARDGGERGAGARRGAGLRAVACASGASACATSMRVEDSLEQGVSHFYAELRA